MLIATVVSFVSFLLILSHLSPWWLRLLAGYKGITDLCLHGTILYMFFGTSTEGLLQAEAAGILFSLWLRSYRYLAGYSRYDFKKKRVVRYTGLLNRDEGRAPLAK